MIKEGSLQDFSLPDLLQILALGEATGTLSLRSEGRLGQVILSRGRVIAATAGERSGEDAAADLFLWTTGVFDFLDGSPVSEEGLGLSLESISQEGLRRLERRRAVLEELPTYFSSRTWVHPMQMYQATPPALLTALGSGKTFTDLARVAALSELELLEELARLYREDQIGFSCAPEELLRQLFTTIACELFNQFSSISGVKMVDGLENRLNEEARAAALSLRWRGGKVQDNLPQAWNKEQLLLAYRPQLLILNDFIAKVYGPAFVQRIVQPLLEGAPAPQIALWNELSATPHPQS